MVDKYDLLFLRLGQITIYRCFSLDIIEITSKEFLKERGFNAGLFKRTDAVIPILLSEGWEPFSIGMSEVALNPTLFGFRRKVE